MHKLKLKEVSKILSGVYLRPSPIGNIAYLQVSDLQRPNPEKTAITAEFAPKHSRYLIRKGDLLFAGKGNTYLCKLFDADLHAVPSTTLYIIRPTSDCILPEYLQWYLLLPQVEAKIKSSQVGSNLPLIHKSTLEEIEIPVPDEKTQSRIVELSKLQQKELNILSAIAEKRAQITNQKLINIIMNND